MKTPAVAPTLSLLAALLLALSLALACGDDDDGGDATASTGDSDGGTLAGYFAHVERIFQDAEDATNEAEKTLNETPSGAELDVRLSALSTYLAEIDTIFNDAIGRLEGLSVPAAVADYQQEFIAGVRGSVTAGNVLRSDLTGITSDEQLDDRLAEFEDDGAAAVELTSTACLALQEIADSENISVDLAC